MATMNKIQKRMALGLVDQWRAEGVPFWVTAYEAYTLTNGIAGVAQGTSGAAKPMHLAELAAKVAKKNAKAVR